MLTTTRTNLSYVQLYYLYILILPVRSQHQRLDRFVFVLKSDELLLLLEVVMNNDDSAGRVDDLGLGQVVSIVPTQVSRSRLRFFILLTQKNFNCLKECENYIDSRQGQFGIKNYFVDAALLNLLYRYWSTFFCNTYVGYPQYLLNVCAKAIKYPR